jgi:hypothetical protein
MTEILFDIQYGFAAFIGPWLIWGFALVIVGGVIEAVIDQVHRPITTVHIEGRDDVY